MKQPVFYIVKALFYLISFLPFRIIYAISDCLFFLIYYIIRYRKDVVFKNLRSSFPEKNDREIQKIAREFYHFLSDQLLESIKMLTITRESVKARFRINNLQEVTRHFDNNKAVIAITGHYGNWEWGGLIISILLEQPVIIVYKPLTDKKFEQLINRMRSRFNAILAPMKNILRKVTEYKNKSYLAILVGDQTPARSEISYFTQFMNQPTAVFTGAEKLAKMTRNPVVYCHINRYKRGFYECTFHTLADIPESTAEKEITNFYLQKLEEIIREKPELWLWSHRRWKYSANETVQPREDAPHLV
ncbi:lysophospholipid acyltransferase family protein [Desertivirga xinjiangensis]|uniref:lysophospholipid acyltransferase family protein n=1 Tax=Desertivirga xinjiangensis TaxID=539206 RepID=UPI00210E7EA4|nr:lysophospholipid acyltransferase family protein [Pedobacter xinjiangensis]